MQQQKQIPVWQNSARNRMTSKWNNFKNTLPIKHWISITWRSFIFKSFCSVLNVVTLGFASAVEFCCLVITIFCAFDVTSVSSHSCIYLRSLNARTRGSSFHLDCFMPSRTPLWGGRHKCLTVADGHRYPNYASLGDDRDFTSLVRWRLERDRKSVV